MDIEKLRTFCAMMEHKTLSEVSKIRRLTVSGVHRQIASLENELGKKLFEKHQKWLKPTTHATLFYTHSLKIIEDYDHALQALNEENEGLIGEFSINASTTSMDTWLMEDLSGFMNSHPDLSFNLIGSNKRIAKIMNEADVFIRTEKMNSAGWECWPLREFHSNLYASREYIDENGAPQTAEDLKEHRIILQGSPSQPLSADLNWHLSYLPSGYKNTVLVNTGLGVYTAVKNSVGLGIVTVEWIRDKGNDLVPVFTRTKSDGLPVYFVFQKNTAKMKAITKLYDYLKKLYS